MATGHLELGEVIVKFASGGRALLANFMTRPDCYAVSSITVQKSDIISKVNTAAPRCSHVPARVFVSVTSQHVTQTPEEYSSRALQRMSDLHMTRSEEEALISTQIVFISCYNHFL